jgi:hypothetical protein
MSEAALAKKLKLRAGHRAALIEAPQGYAKKLGPPEGVRVSTQLSGEFDWIQIFVRNQAELIRIFPRVIEVLGPQSLLWIAYPKGTSRIQTDLTRDQGWDVVQSADLKWVSLISVDDTWSAFALRPYRPGETKQTFR